VEQPATRKSADNSQEDVEHDALTSPIYNLAADEPCDQAENGEPVPSSGFREELSPARAPRPFRLLVAAS